MAVIERVEARTVLDSRGNLTVEAEVFTVEGYGSAAAPSGASTGEHEVTAFREGAPGQTVKAIDRQVEPALVGIEVSDQEAVDSALEEVGGEDFSDLGGNGAVAVSLAAAKTAADERGLPLFRYLGGTLARYPPFPLGNVVGGGAHASGGTDIQEFLVAAEEAPTTETAVLANAEVHGRVGERLEESGDLAGGKGDEGAWIANLDADSVLRVIRDACDEVEEDMDVSMGIGLDVAASELWDPEKGVYVYSDGERDQEEQMDFMASLSEDYELIYIEDPLHEEDFEGFAELSLSVDASICGDDLFVTQASRIERGASVGACDSVLIKPNQVGTLTGTREAVEEGEMNGMFPVISHRSGETADATIAHLGTAFDAPLIKTGVVGGERTSKLNELMRIEEMV